MKYYYASPDNKTAGPVTVEEIQAMIKSGALKADPMVVPEGSSDWRPLSAHLAGTSNGAPPPPPPASHGSMAADKALSASKDALTAFKILATNPVGGLPTAYESLGPSRAFGAGIAFGALSAILLLLVAYRVTSLFGFTHSIDFFFKALLFSLVPFFSLWGASIATRMAFRGQGGFAQDCFIAGAAMLPIVLAGLIAFILGPNNPNAVTAVFVFALCLMVLMLFSGLTRISKISEQAASFAVPIVILIAAALSEWLFKSMMNAMMGGGGMVPFN
jgi:GYF domain 2